jgi:hypothetical protein
LPNAINPVFTDLEMYLHGNSPVAAAAAAAETAATDDDKETAAAAAASKAVDKTNVTVKDVAELHLGGLPRRQHRLFDMPTSVPFAPPPYTSKAPIWRPPNTVPFVPPPYTGKPHRLLDLPPTVPLAPPPDNGKDPTYSLLDSNLPLSENMAREAMDIADEAIADEATAVEATAAATLGSMRQIDPLIVVGKKKRIRQITAPAPPPPAPGPTCRSTRATKNKP